MARDCLCILFVFFLSHSRAVDKLQSCVDILRASYVALQGT